MPHTAPARPQRSIENSCTHGSKIAGLQPVDSRNGHHVGCKTALSPMLLKSECLKKA